MTRTNGGDGRGCVVRQQAHRGTGLGKGDRNGDMGSLERVAGPWHCLRLDGGKPERSGHIGGGIARATWASPNTWLRTVNPES
jgi:hypothetical protein